MGAGKGQFFEVPVAIVQTGVDKYSNPESDARV